LLRHLVSFLSEVLHLFFADPRLVFVECGTHERLEPLESA
jgi:hypothetical protein